MTFLKKFLFLITLTLCASSFAQGVKVITNKGTLITIEQSIGNVAEIYDGTGGQTINEGTFSDIDFSATGIVDATDFTAGTNSITINTPGRYNVTYRVSTETTNNNRNGGEFYLDVAGTESAGTRAYTYNRNNLVDKNTVTVTKVIAVSTTPTIIKVKGQVYASNQGGTSSSLDMVANGSSLLVTRIK